MKKILQNIATVLITTVYVISPIDIVPDIIPIMGQLDDVTAIFVALAYIAYNLRRKDK